MMSQIQNTTSPNATSAAPLLPPGAYERQRRIAESLQQVLLRTPHAESLPGLSVETFYAAVLDEAAVGGDSYDAFALTGGRAALVVADASGKGLAAAERVAEVRFALRAFLREHDDPRRALSCLNDFVCEARRLGGRDASTFVTLSLVVLDGRTGMMTCLCAGGEPPLVLRKDGSVEVVQACGMALGLFPAQEYEAATVHLEESDAVLLTTDGLTEARGSAQESRPRTFLGLEGLARLAAQAQRGAQVQTGKPLQKSALTLLHIGQTVFEGARTFASGTFHDDACLLIGRREEYSTATAEHQNTQCV